MSGLINNLLTDGIILIDKPEGLSSYDCIRKIKQSYPKGYKIGHCGTLDPFASGLLIILVGKATKLQSFLMSDDKIYTGIIKLGVKTDSADITGNIINQSIIPSTINLAGLINYTYDQIPPAFSAKKINGQKSYDLARKGITHQLKPVTVTIKKYSLKKLSDTEIEYFAHTSKGTYIRTLNEDYFAKQNILATTKTLRRVASGIFNFNDFTHQQSFDLAALGDMLKIPRYFVTTEKLKAVINANELVIPEARERIILIYYLDKLVAYYERQDNKNKYKPILILNENYKL